MVSNKVPKCMALDLTLKTYFYFKKCSNVNYSSVRYKNLDQIRVNSINFLLGVFFCGGDSSWQRDKIPSHKIVIIFPGHIRGLNVKEKHISPTGIHRQTFCYFYIRVRIEIQVLKCMPVPEPCLATVQHPGSQHCPYFLNLKFLFIFI